MAGRAVAKGWYAEKHTPCAGLFIFSQTGAWYQIGVHKNRSAEKHTKCVARFAASHYTLGMKSITLCGINARYTHTNLALRCLQKTAVGSNAIIVETNINDSVSAIVHSIIETSPDAVGFSCYIWNIDHVLKAASTVKKILPDCFVIFGGPEVGKDGAALLGAHPFIDMAIRGAGELPFAHFAQQLIAGGSIMQTPSAAIRSGSEIIITQDAPPFEISELPFLYGDIAEFKNKIVYYETSRGCPYRCAFCISAGEAMTYLPLDRVAAELEHFFKAGVAQVKLVDRTFNYPPKRARTIVETLLTLAEEYPQASPCFHFELSANLLDDETLGLLQKAPAGLIQVEIGVQSTNPKTLEAVCRDHDTGKLLAAAKTLCAMPNIHVHVDLIAGLPFEDYTSFAKSFNDVYALGAQRIQLGFLKVLKDSAMRGMASDYDIIYTDYAPYEVLCTHVLSYDELEWLHRISDVVDLLVSSGHFIKTLDMLIESAVSPFDFFEAITTHLKADGFFDAHQSKSALFAQLCSFAQSSPDTDRAAQALRYDWLCLEKPRRWPKGLESERSDAQLQAVRDFFNNKQRIQKYLPEYQNLSSSEVSRRCHVAFFTQLFDKPTAVLFDYGKRCGDEGFAQTISDI